MGKALWDIYHHRAGNHDTAMRGALTTPEIKKTNKSKLPGFVMDLIKPMFVSLAQTNYYDNVCTVEPRTQRRASIASFRTIDQKISSVVQTFTRCSHSHYHFQWWADWLFGTSWASGGLTKWQNHINYAQWTNFNRVSKSLEEWSEANKVLGNSNTNNTAKEDYDDGAFDRKLGWIC